MIFNKCLVIGEDCIIANFLIYFKNLVNKLNCRNRLNFGAQLPSGLFLFYFNRILMEKRAPQNECFFICFVMFNSTFVPSAVWNHSLILIYMQGGVPRNSATLLESKGVEINVRKLNPSKPLHKSSHIQVHLLPSTVLGCVSMKKYNSGWIHHRQALVV